MSRRGIALILSLIIVTILTILAAAIIMRSISESNITSRYRESTQAFWLAEAGLNRALFELIQQSCSVSVSVPCTNLGQGRYCVDVVVGIGQERFITAHGFIPSATPARVERVIEFFTVCDPFYYNAIYSAGDVRFSGNSYTVNGNVRYAGSITPTNPPYNVNGTVTNDPLISPLRGGTAFLQQLYNISLGQNNVYSTPQDFVNKPFPNSFWFSPGVPNVIYILGRDLNLNGNIGTVAAFFVVAGDPSTDPDAAYDVRINGNGQIDGVIYARGQVRIDGGGGGLNVNAGIWAGQEVRVSGNVTLAYKGSYMRTIKRLQGARADVYRDQNSPYPLTP